MIEVRDKGDEKFSYPVSMWKSLVELFKVEIPIYKMKEILVSSNQITDMYHIDREMSTPDFVVSIPVIEELLHWVDTSLSSRNEIITRMGIYSLFRGKPLPGLYETRFMMNDSCLLTNTSPYFNRNRHDVRRESYSEIPWYVLPVSLVIEYQPFPS